AQLRGNERIRKQAVVEQAITRMLPTRRGKVWLVEAKSKAGINAGAGWITNWFRNGDNGLSRRPTKGRRNSDSKQRWHGRRAQRDPRDRHGHVYRDVAIRGRHALYSDGQCPIRTR